MKLRTLVVLAITLLGTTAAHAVDEVTMRRADFLVERGVHLLEKGEKEKARKQIDKALKAFPHHPGAHMLLGHLAMGEEKYEEALEHYDHAKDGYELLIRENGSTGTPVDLPGAPTMDAHGNVMEQGSREQIKYGLQANTRSGDTGAKSIDGAGKEKKEAKVPPTVGLYRGRALLGLKRYDDAIHVWLEIADEVPIAHTHLAAAYTMRGTPVEGGVELAKAEAAGIKVNAELREWVYAEIQKKAAAPTPVQTPAAPKAPETPDTHDNASTGG